jgi:superfamily II DNA or RNA helicase
MTRDERQEICRIKWIKNKCKGVIVAPTGLGKTRIALNCINTLLSNYPTSKIIVIVPTTGLKSQWITECDKRGFGLNVSVQVINSAIKNEQQCDLLVLDEIHRYAGTETIKVFKKIKYKLILGLTATIERLDGRDELIKKYCPIVDEIPLIEAQINHWISDYKEYLVLLDVDNIDEYEQLDTEFQKHFEFFNYNFNLAMSLVGVNGFANRLAYRDAICLPSLDKQSKSDVLKQITYHAVQFSKSLQKRKAFVNNHPKKIEVARKIINARPNCKIITFSNNIKMADAIKIGESYSGRSSKKRSDDILERFNKGEFNVLNTCQKANEGLDIAGLSVAIMLGLDSSKIKATQKRGRVIRKEDSKQAEIFYLIINDTNEVNWFYKSHSGSPFITIGEDGLDQVLRHEPPTEYRKHITPKMFRF